MELIQYPGGEPNLIPTTTHMHCALDLLFDNARKCKGQPVAEQRYGFIQDDGIETFLERIT
jgi:hypothetical protein